MTRPLLITGGAGTLGMAASQTCERRGIEHVRAQHASLDICDERQVEEALASLAPWAVLNTAGFVRVDDAESEWDACYRGNVEGPLTLARACARAGVPLVTFSSDLVFDGAKRAPYVESDPCNPLNNYGRSKVEAERGVRAAHPGSLVIRTSAFFGPWDQHNFAHHVLSAIAAGRELMVPSDVTVSPTYVPDLVQTTLDLLIDGEQGIWHLATPGAVTWAAFAALLARQHGLDTRLLHARPVEELGLAATRPRYSALTSERGVLLPPLDDAIARYLSQAPDVVRSSADQ